MKVTFWGCRGSLPASFRGEQTTTKIRKVLEKSIEKGLTQKDEIDDFIDSLPFDLKSGYGTNTPCVQIDGGDEVVICDAGSGIRDLGRKLVMKGADMPKEIHLLMSHLHWDHIQGFPFFIPAYIQGVTINIYGCHHNIEKTFVAQQENPTFPVALRDMGSQINFHHLSCEEEYEIGNLNISLIEQPHPGTSYGFRFRQNEKTVVYSTDAEHGDNSQSADYPYLKFINGADVLIFDAQFNLADHLFTKQNWGHSSNLTGVELAVRGTVKKLVLFHGEHTFGDHELQKFLNDTKRYQEIYDESYELDIMIAYDGLELEV